MKKVVFALLLVVASAFAGNHLSVSVCQDTGYNCFVYKLDDVRSYKWINDNKVLRITYMYGAELDLNLGGMKVDIKKW